MQCTTCSALWLGAGICNQQAQTGTVAARQAVNQRLCVMAAVVPKQLQLGIPIFLKALGNGKCLRAHAAEVWPCYSESKQLQRKHPCGAVATLSAA